MPDILAGVEPALSTTTDMPAALTPAPAAEATPAPAVEVKPENGDGATPASAEGETSVETKPADGEARPAKSGKPISERFSEMSAQRKAADERAAKAVDAANKATEALNKALSTIEQLTGRNAETAKTALDEADPKPKRETFDNPDAYDTALVEWAGRRAATAATAEAEKRILEKQKTDKDEADKKATEEANTRMLTEWNGKVAKTKEAEEFADYDEVVLRDDLPITIPMSHAILNSDIGPQVAYYLGKNPEEAARIAQIPNPVRQAAEIGRIEAKLLAPKPQVSKTPDPIKPLGSKAPATPKTPQEESMEEYAARRSAELAAQRRPAGGRAATTH